MKATDRPALCLGSQICFLTACAALLASVRTPSQVGDKFGWSVAHARDWNADTHPDVVVGAIQARFPVSAIGSGYARVFSGLDGTQLHQFTGRTTGDELGYGVAGVGDANNDGAMDLVIGELHNARAGGAPERSGCTPGRTSCSASEPPRTACTAGR